MDAHAAAQLEGTTYTHDHGVIVVLKCKDRPKNAPRHSDSISPRFSLIPGSRDLVSIVPQTFTGKAILSVPPGHSSPLARAPLQPALFLFVVHQTAYWPAFSSHIYVPSLSTSVKQLRPLSKKLAHAKTLNPIHLQTTLPSTHFTTTL